MSNLKSDLAAGNSNSFTTKLGELSSFLTQEQIRTQPETLSTYGQDWIKILKSTARAVLFPRTTEDVCGIVHWARKHKQALVPSGGRTGLSGGAAATRGEVVLSMELMNGILEFSALDQTLRVQAGIITEVVQNFAKDKGLCFPVDFASRGSSQIGGNIATNAGGIKVVRYGLIRQWVMGMKVVTGGGEILDLNQGLIKNATGYDFRQLFIGSEGTLGIVTEATLALCAPPKNPKVLLLGLEDLAAVMKVYEHFKLHSSLLAFELFTAAALELVQAHSHLAFPLKNQSGYFLVVEFESSSPAVGSTPENESAEDADLQLFSTLFECGWVVDGAMAQNEKQAREFWRFREDISESAAPYQPYKNDISVRISCVPEFLTEVQQLLTKEYPEFRVVWFGHIGDGNLHINVLKPADMPAADFTRHCARVNDLLFASVAHFHGSVSAEHGIGLMKKPYLHFSRSQEEIQIMRQIKNIFDPDSILNPGKLFDP